MMSGKFFTYVAAAALLNAATCNGWLDYQEQIPNGHQVPNPCQAGAIWAGVGHQSPDGGNAKNPFGLDFASAGARWTAGLCRKDSDGDGLTNGQELGDPDCVWTPGATPARTSSLSHPGICPLDSTTCTNPWTVCPKVFSCPALSDPGVTVRNFTMTANTPVPAEEMAYMCQAFELNNTASPVHLIGSRPIIVNKVILHHMIMYACDSRPQQSMFDSPKQCFMVTTNCSEVMNIWAYGTQGECFNSNAGFRIGGAGYRYAILQLTWNNPLMLPIYQDSSGFSLYFTSNLRKYDLGTSVYGELNIVLPPSQPLVSLNHTCPSVCTSRYHAETRYITAAGIHMHTYGINGRISLWRSGILVKDLMPMQVYDYNSPQMIPFDPPVEFLKGDEVRTECYYSTLTTNSSTFYGENITDEMCFAYLSYYPNNVSLSSAAKLGRCSAVSGINQCWLQTGVTPQVERDCNITGMMTGEIPARVFADMSKSLCFARTGCDTTCRNYLNYSLWPSNACYDPKRAGQMSEALSTGIIPMLGNISQLIANTLSGQRYCRLEIELLASNARMMAMTVTTTSAPALATSSGLTSEHQLIIILVCSCLGTVLVLAILGLFASKLPPGCCCQTERALFGHCSVDKTTATATTAAAELDNVVITEKSDL